MHQSRSVQFSDGINFSDFNLVNNRKKFVRYELFLLICFCLKPDDDIKHGNKKKSEDEYRRLKACSTNKYIHLLMKFFIFSIYTHE